MPSRAEKAETNWWCGTYHEAGHAAVAVAFEIPLQHIELGMTGGILSDLDAEGGLYLAEPTDLEDPDAIVASIILSFAGAEADAWWRQHHYQVSIGRARRMAFANAGGDLSNIARELQYLEGGRRLGRQLAQEATVMVGDLWDSIDAIAEALRDNNGYLTGDQIYGIA